VLNTAPFKSLMRQFKMRFEWIKAMPCSCYDPRQNYDAQRSCDKCDHGYVYRDQGAFYGAVEPTTTTMQHPEWGIVQVGELTLVTMPDEVPFGPFDKVRLFRGQRERVRVSRGDNSLGHTHIITVDEIADDDTVYHEVTDYTVNRTTGIITWVTTGPTNVYAADITYQPTYWYLGSGEPPHETGGPQLSPQRGLLRLAPPVGAGG
jgi:hypothetical protein